jgi:hypothetical protein
VDEWFAWRHFAGVLMVVGIISEGRTDQAVLTNLVVGLTELDKSSIRYLRPDNFYDETDLNYNQRNTFGGWSYVRDDCIDSSKFEQFFAISDNEFIIIQIDSLQASDYGALRPNVVDENFSVIFRENIIRTINDWLNNRFADNIIYAIAIEEIEAWILTLYEDRNSSTSKSPKVRLHEIVLPKHGKKCSETFENYLNISSDFCKPKQMKRRKCFANNESLKLFCLQLDDKLNKNTLF